MEKQDIESMLNQPTKIKWACRRGMLELDVLLSNFFEKGYNELNDDGKRLFIELLYLPDPELFALLMGRAISPDKHVTELVLQIRSHARG